MRMQVLSLASLGGSGIRRGHKLWCGSQTQLGSLVAVAVVQTGSCSSNLTPSLRTSIYCRCGPKKQKKKKKKRYLFSLVAVKIFFLCLLFRNLIMMCLECISLCFFTNMKNFQPLFLQAFFSTTFFLFFSQDASKCECQIFSYIVLQVFRLC